MLRKVFLPRIGGAMSLSGTYKNVIPEFMMVAVVDTKQLVFDAQLNLKVN